MSGTWFAYALGSAGDVARIALDANVRANTPRGIKFIVMAQEEKRPIRPSLSLSLHKQLYGGISYPATGGASIPGPSIGREGAAPWTWASVAADMAC